MLILVIRILLVISLSIQDLFEYTYGYNHMHSFTDVLRIQVVTGIRIVVMSLSDKLIPYNLNRVGCMSLSVEECLGT